MTSLKSGFLMSILYTSVITKRVYSIFLLPNITKILAIRDLFYFNIAK